ncbi:uncharacterized protein LOC110708066 [Chenopodium quinoa]|uniref:uncharacterized protein LOC110708066 n=1 Tax=Chenopodium quinoa TaxID=63459 RepID=UPI000B78A852|nr:uncharacterized protein LOC110708066 [Chenopodium quinoa]
MRPTLLLVFLVTLHLLLCEAYGVRLGKFAMRSATSQPTNLVVHENENTMKRLDDDQNYIIVDKREISTEVKCEDDEDHCSSKGKYRKLITSTTIPTSSAKPIQENLDNEEKRMSTKREDEAQTLSSSSIHHNYPSTAYALDKHHEIAPPEYENAMDMTVMDYSPAKKKPPIHN